MEKERFLSATEVCVLVDCSIYSLNNWYIFKKENPDNEYAKMLPDFTNLTTGSRRKRYWKQSDIGKLIEFKATIPHGRNGVLGSVTQRYVKKKGVKNGKKKSTKRNTNSKRNS